MERSGAIWSSAARDLLGFYSGRTPNDPTELPVPVERWLAREIADFGSVDLWRHPRRSLELRKDGKILALRLSSASDGACHVVLLEEKQDLSRSLGAAYRLSPREKEVLAWIASGKTNPEIGEILGVSIHTVKNHVKRILECRGVENRTAAAAVWIESGFGLPN